MAGFKARARALDMLGRQQIAGIPTAISELFKNAYDAYADNVVVDFFRSDGLFLIRDDGFGMTKEEFENRWLTIGTESKIGGLFGLANTYIPKDKEPRILMGEKGIGRLAIAMLGAQVLIITKAIRANEEHGYVVSFINWKLFECPGLNLEDIYIPVKEFESFPLNYEINDIINECIESVKLLSKKIESSFFDSIIKDLNTFSQANIIDNEKYLEEPCKLTKDDSGTRFYIYPSNEYIINDIENTNREENDISELKKMLIGFTDIVMPGHKKIPLKTHFRDYKHPEYYEDVINDTNFFTEDEFLEGDHIFEGKFDEFGQFEGKVRIFGEEKHNNYIIPWNSSGKKTNCGPFEIVLMTIQGKPSESNLDKIKHKEIDDKLRNFGGLYVYKDGIRILPYGDNRYDFLDIEKRRTLHAGNNYWSYRRMFGAIRLKSSNNYKLKEKAGREGFQENYAYSEIRSILIKFLKQTAKDFFNDGIYSDFYQMIKESNRKRDELLLKEEKKKKNQKEKFIKSLQTINNQIINNYYEGASNTLLKELEIKLLDVDNIQNKELAALKLMNIEKELLKNYRELTQEIQITKPKGMAFKQSIEQDYLFYVEKLEDIEKNILQKLYNQIQILISEKSDNVQVQLDRRYRITQSLETISKDVKKTINSSVKETDEILDEVQEKVMKTTKSSLTHIEETIREVNQSVQRTDFQDMSEKEIANWRIKIEEEVISAMNSEKDELETIKQLLDKVNWEKDENGKVISYIDVIQANDSKINELKEQSDLDSDLAQLGMAVHVINHEFDASIKVVRENLRRLKGWSDVNAGLTGIYKGIKNSFEHLDSYLTLFTPLNRRLQRNRTKIRGNEIEEFIDKLFSDRFKRHNISFKASKKFRQSNIETFPSTLYPVFVNIIDNATYWVKNKKDAHIYLDSDQEGYIISNNGSEIVTNDEDNIFEVGFSRKPSGRGLGLHIVKEVLNEQNMDIQLVKPLTGYSVSFKILFNKDLLNG